MGLLARVNTKANAENNGPYNDEAQSQPQRTKQQVVDEFYSNSSEFEKQQQQQQ